METKYKYVTTALLSLLVGAMASLGVDVSVDTVSYDEGYLPYDCSLENVEPMMCYKLSRVGTTGVNRNCYYDRDRSTKYKVCSTGWERIINTDECPQQECKPLVISYICDVCEGGIVKYYSNGIGLEADYIRDDTLENPCGVD